MSHVGSWLRNFIVNFVLIRYSMMFEIISYSYGTLDHNSVHDDNEDEYFAVLLLLQF